jgi:hypothetical protein
MRTPYVSEVTARLDGFLRENCLTLHEYLLVMEIGECSNMPESQLLRRIMEFRGREFPDAEPMSETALHQSLEGLMSRGLLQRIDAASLQAIASSITMNGVPVTLLDDLPRVGDIDFTLNGAELYGTIERTVFCRTDDEFWLEIEVHGQPHSFEVFAPTRTSLDRYVEDTHREMEVVTSSPERIGAWKTRWWRGFPGGWKLFVWTGEGGV